jgi:hypothetical protein
MADITITSDEFLAQEFEFEYCEDCHGDQQDHRLVQIAILEPRWSVACSAEQDWQQGKRWVHPCRIDNCNGHSKD